MADDIPSQCFKCKSSIREVEFGCGRFRGSIRVIFICGHSMHPFSTKYLTPPDVDVLLCDICSMPVERKSIRTKRHPACQPAHMALERRRKRLEALRELLKADFEPEIDEDEVPIESLLVIEDEEEEEGNLELVATAT